jgi:penicillin G amidase
MGREYPVARGLLINKKLAGMSKITPKDMMTMQTDNYNIYAEQIMPMMLKSIQAETLNGDEKHFADILAAWNKRNDLDSKGATAYDYVYKQFKENVYNDEYEKAPKPILIPFESTLIEASLKDSNYVFFDDIKTPAKEGRKDMFVRAFKEAVVKLTALEKEGKLDWAKSKATHIDHLLKVPAFNRTNLAIGGGKNMINATTETHGPSWRMVVSLTKNTEAYGIYPGGQNGNPGSKYYDMFIDEWAEGKYYSLWMMKKEEAKDARVKFVMNFSN